MKHDALTMALLYDYYGELLTEKQRTCFDHRPRMNARIRPPCADHVDRRAAHPRQHGLELALNGLLARLTLPAKIAGAVIAERHLEISHPRGSPFFVYRQAG